MADTTSPQRTVLFTDLRHIRCGDLEWYAPDGSRLPLIAPPQPQSEAYARTGYVPHGIRLVAQRGTKTEPLPNDTRLGRVTYENGVYRSWYLDVQYPPGRNFGSYSKDMPVSVSVCSRESPDGFEWREPKRCPIDVPGQTSLDGFTFFVDPKGDAAERYKAVYTAVPPEQEWPSLWGKFQLVHPRHKDHRLTEKRIYGIYGLVSPDGIHWQPIREPLLVHLSDTDTSVYYDSWIDRYVMYTRLYWQERRWIGRAEAQDFCDWGPVEPLIWPSLDEPFSYDIYTNGRTEYPGLPGYHLMFPMVYHRNTQTSEVHLFSSTDGICWNRVPGGPVLSPGKPGDWDSEFIHSGGDLVPLGNSRIGNLYHGTSFPHKYPRWDGVLRAGRTAWAWWPKGRICAIVADEQGEFYTFPLVPAGRELRLNVRVRRGGEVRVGLVGIDGRTAETDCASIYGDHLALPVHWNGQSDIGARDGDPVTLHFKLRSAELFGVEWV